MSAYMVDVRHIDALLTAGIDYGRRDGGSPLRWWHPAIDDGSSYDEIRSSRRELTLESAGTVGAMLLAENRASVNYRYREDELEPPYVFTWYQPALTPVEVLKALDGLEYQSCEHRGWHASEAKSFIDALRRRAIKHVPGYDTAGTWSVS